MAGTAIVLFLAAGLIYWWRASMAQEEADRRMLAGTDRRAVAAERRKNEISSGSSEAEPQPMIREARTASPRVSELARDYLAWLDRFDGERAAAYGRMSPGLATSSPLAYYQQWMADTGAFHTRFTREAPNCPPQCIRLKTLYDSGLTALETAQCQIISALQTHNGPLAEQTRLLFGHAADLLREADAEMQTVSENYGLSGLHVRV